MSGSASQSYSPSGPFSDAIIRVGGVEFHVHKIILYKCSKYFKTLFACPLTHERQFFEIPGLSADMMQLIVEFAYTLSVPLTENNAQELLHTANMLNINSLAQVCCNFLVEKLCPNNCIGFWQLPEICSCPKLRYKAFHYILNHFEEVVSSEEFQMLSVQELTYVLDRDELIVRQESTVCEAVFKWISHAPEERKKHIAILLSKVRLALTSLDYLMTLSSGEEWCNIQCLDVVSRAIEFKRHMNLSRPPLSVCANTIARPRQPNAILLAIGGWCNRSTTNAIEVYDIRTNQWNNMTDLRESPLSYHGSVFYHNSVYCVGGFHEDIPSNQVRRFDLKTRSWEEAAPMHECRTYVAVTVLNGYIYAFGGRDGPNRLKTAECYNPKTNQWSYIASMHASRSSSSCTVFNNKIYICGGYNGNRRLDSCEYYTPETNKWKRFTSMTTQRSAHSIIAHEHQIFAVGGFDGNQTVNSVEAYNPQTNVWHAVTPMSNTRSYFGLELIENKIFAVGGCHDVQILNNVEYYDAIKDQWYSVSNMKIARSALSCCVVSELPNIAEYIISRDTLPKLDQTEGTLETEDAHLFQQSS